MIGQIDKINMPRNKNFDEIEALQKAKDLFWRKGYNATSIQDLVNELGINRASLYDTWGDKHQLYLAALKLYRQDASSWLLDQIRSDQPARQIIVSFFNRVVDDVLNDPQKKGCFVVNSTTELANMDNDVLRQVEENREIVISVLTELIKEGQVEGEFKSTEEANNLARFIFTTIIGLRVIAKGDVTESELRSIISIALKALD